MAITLVQQDSSVSTANSVSASITISSTGVNSALVLCVGNFNSRTVVSVTDNQSNVYTQATGAAASQSTGRCDIWYCLTPVAGVTSITATYSGAASTFSKELWAFEFTGMTGVFTVDDVAKRDSAASGTSTFTGAPVTASQSSGCAVAVIIPTVNVIQNPKAGNAFNAGGEIDTSFNAACSLTFSSTGTYTPEWLTTGAGSFCSSTVLFSETPVGPARITQEFVETFIEGAAPVAITQEMAEVWTESFPPSRITQALAESWVGASSPVAITQALAESWIGNEAPVAITQAFVEVWYTPRVVIPSTPTQVEGVPWKLLRFDFKYRLEEEA
jgi:hypothetical protein